MHTINLFFPHSLTSQHPPFTPCPSLCDRKKKQRCWQHQNQRLVSLSHPCKYVCVCVCVGRTYASICICVHTHTHIHIHRCVQSAGSVFADVYVGVNIHLCNIHNCPCTSAQNTCKVHITLTAKKCTYIYTYTHTYTHAYTHENTCACMTLSTR